MFLIFNSSPFGVINDGFGIFTPSAKIPMADVNKKETWNDLVKDGKYFPYLGLFGFEDTTPENEVATSSTGIKQSIRDGKPEFTITYPAPLCLVKSLHNKKGYNWRIVLYTNKGIYLTTDVAKENVTGFLAPYFDVSTFKFKSGTDIQQVNVMFQIEDSDAFNTKGSFITWEALGFDLREVQGAFNATLQVTAPAGTEITVKAISTCNADLNYIGLEQTTNWSVNGVAPTAVTYNTATSDYSLTVPAMTSGDKITVVLNGEDALDNVYRGSVTATVTA